MGVGEATVVSTLTYDDHIHGRHDEHSLIAGTNRRNHVSGCFTAKTGAPPVLTFPRHFEHLFDVHLPTIQAQTRFNQKPMPNIGLIRVPRKHSARRSRSHDLTSVVSAFA